MSYLAPVLPFDPNGRMADTPGWWFPVKCSPGAFAGGTTDARGDFDGAGNPYTLFTVTGVVAVKLFAVTVTAPVGATATLEVGVSGGTASLIPQSTATDLAVNEIWVDATPTTKVEPFSSVVTYIVHQDIIETVGTANITAGELDYYLSFYPLSPDGNVVSAV